MKRRSLRRLLKPAMLAFAVSLIIIPSATAMPLQSVGGSGTAGTQDLGPPDGWYIRVMQTQPNSPRDGWYTRVIEPISTSSPGRIAPDVPPVSTSVPVVSQPSGFDWSDFGLGAAGAVLLTALLATMTFVAVRHRRIPLAHR
jgi:hypothetical protein